MYMMYNYIIVKTFSRLLNIKMLPITLSYIYFLCIVTLHVHDDAIRNEIIISLIVILIIITRMFTLPFHLFISSLYNYAESHIGSLQKWSPDIPCCRCHMYCDGMLVCLTVCIVYRPTEGCGTRTP